MSAPRFRIEVTVEIEGKRITTIDHEEIRGVAIVRAHHEAQDPRTVRVEVWTEGGDRSPIRLVLYDFEPTMIVKGS